MSRWAYCTSKVGAGDDGAVAIAVDFRPAGRARERGLPGLGAHPDGRRADDRQLGEQHWLRTARAATASANAWTPRLRRARRPEEVAEAVAWLAQRRAPGYVNGVALPLDGGAEVVDLGLLPFARETPGA